VVGRGREGVVLDEAKLGEPRVTPAADPPHRTPNTGCRMPDVFMGTE